MREINIIKKFTQFKHYPIQYIKNLFSIYLYNFIKYQKLRKTCTMKCIHLNYPPKYVTIGITGYCMNNCQFCASHSIDSGRNVYSKHQYNIPFSMSYEDFCKIVDLCHKAKVPHVHIVAAGEPFLNKDIFRMIDYLASKYCKFSTQSNFNKKLFETNNLLEKILSRKHFIKYITSDIFSQEIHNTIKKGSDYEFLLDSMEYISKNSKIIFDLHTILTKSTYKNLDKVVLDLCRRKIKFTYSLVNLHPHNFNEFTSPNNRYLSTDGEITAELQKLEKIGKKLHLKINIPPPWDKYINNNKGYCETFWERFQVIPDKNLPKDKWIGNVIPSQCNAVIIGKIYSLGNLLDYENLIEFWNNIKLLKIRRDLINGIYPDKLCKTCYKYSDNFNKCI